MECKDLIEVSGIVIEALPNLTFNVDIGNYCIIQAYPSDELRKKSVQVLPGDQVTVQMSLRLLDRGRIIWSDRCCRAD